MVGVAVPVQQAVRGDEGKPILLQRSTLTESVSAELARAPTPVHDDLPRKFADFPTLGDALDYAASGVRGFNFFDARATLTRVYPFSEMREDARAAAYRLIASGVKPGDRIALIAETGPDFAALFFGVVYAGAWPVPLPLPTSFGGRDGYIEQIRTQLKSCDPVMVFSPNGLLSMVAEAAEPFKSVQAMDWESFATLAAPRPSRPMSAICNIPAAAPVFRTASRSRIRRYSPISLVTPSAIRLRPTTGSFPGFPGIMTWALSAACCPRSPTRCRATIWRPRILPAAP
jgi:acyl-CoA synthetase (AMP-forming)/AMP-acid ligase II